MWWWVLTWTLAVLAALAVFVLLGIRLFRQAVALGRELTLASERFAAVSERFDELADAFTPEPSAVFDDPATRRRELARSRAGRRSG